MKLPKGWNEVSIETFLKYYTISTRKWADPIDLEVNILSCFSGLPPKEIEKLKTRELSGYIKKLDFLKKLPTQKVSSAFVCNGKRYRASLTMDDMTAGQFMNFSDILKGVKPGDYVFQMHQLIGAMCIKRSYTMTYPFIKYEYEGYKVSSDEFYKHMTIDIAYPYYVFFCKVMDKSLPAIQNYLSKEMKKIIRSSQKTKWAFLNTGVGI